MTEGYLVNAAGGAGSSHYQWPSPPPFLCSLLLSLPLCLSSSLPPSASFLLPAALLHCTSRRRNRNLVVHFPLSLSGMCPACTYMCTHACLVRDRERVARPLKRRPFSSLPALIARMRISALDDRLYLGRLNASRAFLSLFLPPARPLSLRILISSCRLALFVRRRRRPRPPWHLSQLPF